MSALLPIVSLLLSVFFLMAGAGLQGILLPVRGSIERWSTYEIGLLGTGYAVAFTIGCLLVPRILRRVGHVRTFTSLCALLAIAILLNAIVVHPVAWIAFRAAAGFAQAGSYMVIESWLNERVTNETRGRIFSIYMIVSMSAMMSGQFAMPLARPETPTPFMLGAILFALAIIPTALSRAPSPKPLADVKLDLPSAFRNVPTAAVGVFLAGVIAGSWNNMAPVFGERIGFSTAEIATLLAITQAGGIALQYPARPALGPDRPALRDGRRGNCRRRRGGVRPLARPAGAAGGAGAGLRSRQRRLSGLLAGRRLRERLHASEGFRPDVGKPSDPLRSRNHGRSAPVGLADGAVRTERHLRRDRAAHAMYAAFSFYRTLRRSPVPASERADFQSTPLARTQTPAAFRLDPRAQDASAGTA